MIYYDNHEIHQLVYTSTLAYYMQFYFWKDVRSPTPCTTPVCYVPDNIIKPEGDCKLDTVMSACNL